MGAGTSGGGIIVDGRDEGVKVWNDMFAGMGPPGGHKRRRFSVYPEDHGGGFIKSADEFIGAPRDSACGQFGCGHSGCRPSPFANVVPPDGARSSARSKDARVSVTVRPVSMEWQAGPRSLPTPQSRKTFSEGTRTSTPPR